MFDIAPNSLVPEDQNGFALDFFFYPLSAHLIPKVLSLSSLVLPAGKEELCLGQAESISCTSRLLGHCPQEQTADDFYLCFPQYEQWLGLYLPALAYETCRTLKAGDLCPSGQEEFAILWGAEGTRE